MTTPPITIRRWTSETGKTGWRWTCHTCPPIRPTRAGTGGRPRGGFHWDNRFVFARLRAHPGAWHACLHAAVLHIHVHHRDTPPTKPMSSYPTVAYRSVGA